ncbi:glycosyltransferase family 4 protein [Neiella sp. HB171785]|uniref:Glycosyltransferase family 4 protein n=1 Tax=Neiella litorisoli TaxID=2771431 RepID=A0A8J6UQ88_9GAMM|nr:glycosyltransferase family 4 protein [Neiella litorisoli]MBD1390572.1 glycosyltransferase family 4 protein [Neiella litorisoli]
MKQKTLVVTENFPPLAGGSGRWFYELYSRLPSDQYVVVTNQVEGSQDFDQAQDFVIERMPLSSPEWGIKSLQGLTFYWRTVWALRRLVKRHGITHVHCGRVIHEGVSAWLLSLVCNIKYLCFVHGEDVETAATSREHDLLVKQVCGKAEQIICNSHNSASIVNRLNYAGDDKIQVLHPGVDCQRFVPAAEDPEFKQAMGWTHKQVIITVGRLQQRKGQDMMIRAVAKLKDQFPNILYAIIGRGECKSMLTNLVAELQLEEHVQLLDEISDEQMIQCYQQCDLFILPNRTIANDIEGFGMVLVEAQSCGKAVIAGDSGGTKETLQEGITGHVLDCTDPELMVTPLAALLTDTDKLQQMGQQGRQWAEQMFDWQPHVNKARAIFDDERAS